MIVVDAGPVLELLLGTAVGQQVATILGEEEVAAPDLIDAEVFHGLVRSYRADRLAADELDERVTLLVAMDITRVPSRDVLTIAQRCLSAVSSYDALYVALALILDCTLLTADGKLAATASRQLGIPVTILPPSRRESTD